MDQSHRDDSTDVLDDVRKAEEEIDRFLRANSVEAEKILLKARAEADAVRAQGDRDTQTESARQRDLLLMEAEARAAQIEREGEVAAKAEAERLESLREEVIAHILRLVGARS